MTRRFFAMLMVIIVLVSAFGCSNKNNEDELLYPESKATRGPLTSVWQSDAGTFTFYEGNFVKVEFTDKYEYLLKNHGEDGRNFDNNAEYHCNFFNKLTETSMEEATSFYLWLVNGSSEYNCQFTCSVSGDTMTLCAYWPYDSGNIVFTKVS